MATPTRSVTVWINGFLPAHVPGATSAVESGPFQGCTSLGLLADLPGTWLTDQRPFDANPLSPQQIGTLAEVLYDGFEPQVRVQHAAAFSLLPAEFAADAPDPCIPRVPGDVSRMMCDLYLPRYLSSDMPVINRIRTLPRGIVTTRPEEVAYLSFDSWLPLPDAAWSTRFGDVGYTGIAVVDLTMRRVEFYGEVSRMLAFEMYAQLNGGSAQCVFRLSPARGARNGHGLGQFGGRFAGR